MSGTPQNMGSVFKDGTVRLMGPLVVVESSAGVFAEGKNDSLPEPKRWAMTALRLRREAQGERRESMEDMEEREESWGR